MCCHRPWESGGRWNPSESVEIRRNSSKLVETRRNSSKSVEGELGGCVFFSLETGGLVETRRNPSKSVGRICEQKPCKKSSF